MPLMERCKSHVNLHLLSKFDLDFNDIEIQTTKKDFNGDITKANLRDKNNSYNTYQIPSLPPTPISSISQSSLEAVILGVANEYLYFVANGRGAHDFSRTYKEHLKAVKRYQLNQ